MTLDEELILRAKAQDAEALDKVADYLMKKLPPILKSNFPNLPYADAEDATMVVLEKFIKEPMTIRAQSWSSLFAWAKTVGCNYLRDLIRTKKSKNLPLYIVDGDGNEMELPIVDQSVQEKISQIEQKLSFPSTLQEALDVLSPTDKAIIYNYHVEGIPLNIIARDLGMTVDAVKQRKRRALRKVRKILNNQGITYENIQ